MIDIPPHVAAYRADLAAVRLRLRQQKALLQAAIEGNDRCTELVQMVIAKTVGSTFEAPSKCDLPTSKHRAERRRGRVSKIDTDPQLRSFILDRMDKMTYAAMEREITAAFPADRRVKRSAIHTWWQGQLETL